VSLASLIERSLATVTPALLAQAQARQPGLEPYAKPSAVVAVLSGVGTADPEKLLLTTTLLRGYQDGPRDVFGALLLGGFTKWLLDLRNELDWAPMDDEDLDQLVVTSFLSAAAYVRPRIAKGMLITRLVQRTRRVALGTASSELSFASRRASERVRVKDKTNPDRTVEVDALDYMVLRGSNTASHRLWVEAGHSLPWPSARSQRCSAGDLLRLYGDRMSPATRDLVELVASIPDTSLRAYVDRTTSGAELADRRYQRLKKQEERARDEVWTLFRRGTSAA
jgi:hypothetical protein